MKKRSFQLFAIVVLCCALFSCKDENETDTDLNSSMIIDHTCTNLSKIPEDFVNKAAEDLYVAYNSPWWQGSEITYGLRYLVQYKGTLYSTNEEGEDGALRFSTHQPFGDVRNIEYPRDSSWAKATRDTLNAGAKFNVVMWGWSDAISDAKSAEIEAYLNLMSQLEKDFPNVKFVYMTGPLDGTTKSDNLYLRNEQIRKYCRDNKKILFDFADIESYDPDGNYFGDKLADAACNYDSNGDGKIDGTDKNWAKEWQDNNPKKWYECGPNETQPLNSNLKAYAAWWMFARMAGWGGQ